MERCNNGWTTKADGRAARTERVPGQAKMDEKVERDDENARGLGTKRDGEKITRSRHTEEKGRKKRDTLRERKRESVCAKSTLLSLGVSFSSLRSVVVLFLSLSLSLSFYLFPSLSLLFSLSLSTTCLPFSPVRAGEKRLPILRQGQDRDFNQLARFLGPGK